MPLFVATMLVVTSVLSDKSFADADPLEKMAVVTYYDRNGDGRVDLEFHEHPGVADADWQLRDEDYNGRYEIRVLFGVGGVRGTAVDLEVPTKVRISKGKPFVPAVE